MKTEELIAHTSIYCINENTSGKEYGSFTDKIIVIEQDDNKIILNKRILEYLENVIGAKFR